MAVDHTRSNVEKVATEIQRYLSKHPDSADTLDGVVNWWLLRHRFESAIEVISDALNYLVDTGFVEKLEAHGRQAIYRKAAAMVPQSEHNTHGDFEINSGTKAS